MRNRPRPLAALFAATLLGWTAPAAAQEERLAEPAATLARLHEEERLLELEAERWYATPEQDLVLVVQVRVRGEADDPHLEVWTTTLHDEVQPRRTVTAHTLGLDLRPRAVACWRATPESAEYLRGEVRDGELLAEGPAGPCLPLAWPEGALPREVIAHLLPELARLAGEDLEARAVDVLERSADETPSRVRWDAEAGQASAALVGGKHARALGEDGDAVTWGGVELEPSDPGQVRDVLARFTRAMISRPRYSVAIGILRTLLVGQSLFREGDKDKDGSLDYAAHVSELGDAELVAPSIGSGEHRGWTVSLHRSWASPQFRWGAVVGPVDGRGCWLATNETGQLVRSPVPVALDADGAPPSHCVPVGK